MCMVGGIWGRGDVEAARKLFFELQLGQHRGQESAGIAVESGKKILIHKDMGLVTQVFTEAVLSQLPGCIGIGHTRYSTTGSSIRVNAQPFAFEYDGREGALAHNGDIMNAHDLRDEIVLTGRKVETSSDSEVIAHLISLSKRETIEERIAETMQKLHGAYSLVVVAEGKLIAARDRYGIRPLYYARFNGDGYAVASETCAFSSIGAIEPKKIGPGEMLVLSDRGVESHQVIPVASQSLCVFEFIYFARPDSVMYGKTLHEARRRMGQKLAIEHPALGADFVFPIPDTGTPAAIGYAEASGTRYGEGVIKNRYIHRTFIDPDQRMRDLGVKMKLTPLTEALRGRRVVMVEDSIVRGTTTGQTVRMIKEAGAAEVHVRIASPPIKFPCFYGIDMSARDELIAADMSVEMIRKHIGADSLGYLSLDGLFGAIGVPREMFCHGCLDNEYPMHMAGAGNRRRLES